jgi:tetratricopeptide (TPR) repeat protein
MLAEASRQRISEALAAHRAGDHERTSGICRDFLRLAPDHPEALHLLATSLSLTGQHGEAIAAMERAVAVRPQAPGCWSDLGLVRARAGQLDAAIEAYQRSLALAPGHPPTLAKLGRALDALGHHQQAIEALNQASLAIPADPDIRNALGAALARAGALDAARRELERALQLDPAFGEARQNLANLLRTAGDEAVRTLAWSQAVDCYRALTALQPDHADTHYRLALALSATNQIGEACACYQRALALAPGHEEAANNLAHLHLALGQGEDAVRRLEQAIRLKPDYVEAHYNLGVALQSLDRLEPARQAYQRVLALRPAHADSWNNLGGLLLSERRVPEAIGHYKRALELDPDHLEANWNLALAYLSLGDWEQGWPRYESRLRQKRFPPPKTSLVRWTGDPLAGRRLLVWAEQGLGDTLQFARYLRQIRGGEVIFECHSRLYPLLGCSTELPALVESGGPATPADCEVPLLSLPYLLGARADKVPPPLGGWQLPADIRACWQERLRGYQGIRVGLSWGGNPNNWDGRKRSMPLATLARLGDLDGVRLFSLQRGPQAAERDPRVAEIEGEQSTLVDTAAIIGELDLVITVDTMIAHLAGSLGRPVWTLLPYAADWRWLLEGEQTLWYPSMRLFRQPRPGDWESTVARVATGLQALRSTR